MQTRCFVWGVCCCLFIILLVGNAQAQSDEAFLEYRQRVMKSQGASMGAISDVLKHKLPFTDHIATHAKDLQNSSTLIASAFEKRITEGKTDAKPEAWQEWDKFVAAAKALEEESGKLAEVAASGNMEAIAAQVKKVGGACGNCHKPYRKPEGERFPR
jgi:cytochrome c556